MPVTASPASSQSTSRRFSRSALTMPAMVGRRSMCPWRSLEWKRRTVSCLGAATQPGAARATRSAAERRVRQGACMGRRIPGPSRNSPVPGAGGVLAGSRGGGTNDLTTEEVRGTSERVRGRQGRPSSAPAHGSSLRLGRPPPPSIALVVSWPAAGAEGRTTSPRRKSEVRPSESEEGRGDRPRLRHTAAAFASAGRPHHPSVAMPGPGNGPPLSLGDPSSS